MSFVNEIDDVVYILTVLSFFIFIGCYYLFRTLSLSFYYTHYCKILLYYIIYYIVNTQFSLVAASSFFTNKPSIYLSMHEVVQRPSERWSVEVDLFRLNGFVSYYKFTREKNDWHTLCRERREMLLTVLLVNCHDVTGGIFDRWISRQTGMKSSLKWHNQPRKKIKDF